MPDPRPYRQRVDDAVSDAVQLRRGDETDRYMYGLIAVANAILATAEPVKELVRMGHFVPIEAWSEITIKGLHGMRWAVYSSTLGKNLDEFDDLHSALQYRDHLIQNFDRQGAD